MKKTLVHLLQEIQAAGKLLASYAREAEHAVSWAQAQGYPVPETPEALKELEEILKELRTAYARLGKLEGQWKRAVEDNSARALREAYGL